MWNTAVNNGIMRSVTALFGHSSFAGTGWRFGAVLSVFMLVAFSAAVSSCGNYDPLPPKTEASTSYYIPAPEAPTQAEIDAMKAERAEYNELTK